MFSHQLIPGTVHTRGLTWANNTSAPSDMCMCKVRRVRVYFSLYTCLSASTSTTPISSCVCDRVLLSCLRASVLLRSLSTCASVCWSEEEEEAENEEDTRTHPPTCRCDGVRGGEGGRGEEEREREREGYIVITITTDLLSCIHVCIE